MNRFDALLDLDEALANLERAQSFLLFMECDSAVVNRLDGLLLQLEDLRVAVVEAEMSAEASE